MGCVGSIYMLLRPMRVMIVVGVSERGGTGGLGGGRAVHVASIWGQGL